MLAKTDIPYETTVNYKTTDFTTITYCKFYNALLYAKLWKRSNLFRIRSELSFKYILG